MAVDASAAATPAMTPSEIHALLLAVNDLVSTHQSPPRREVDEEYDPEFPGYNGEPLHVLRPPPPPPPRPEPTELLLCNLSGRTTPQRLEEFIQHFTQGRCRLRQLRIYPNSDHVHCWARVSFFNGDETRYAQYILHRRTLDGELVRACFDPSAV